MVRYCSKPLPSCRCGGKFETAVTWYKTDKVRSCSPYHVSKGGNEEEENGEDAHQCAVGTRLDYFLGYSLQGIWEELEHTQQIRES